MRPIHSLLPLSLAAAVPAAAQVGSAPNAQPRADTHGRDSLDAVFLTAEGRSITFIRAGGEPGLRVVADRTQTRRTP
jgi:hypothetical protein